MCGEGLAPVYVQIPQSVQDAAEGAGDVLSFGGTAKIRQLIDLGNESDKCSLSYSAGQVAGAVVQTYLVGSLVKLVNGATTLQAWFLTAKLLLTDVNEANELLAMEEAAQLAAQEAAMEASAEAALERQMEIINAAAKVIPKGPIIR